MKNVRKDLVEHVTTDSECVEARLVRLGCLDRLMLGGLPVLASRNDSKHFRNYIEFLLDWQLLERQNRFMASLVPNQRDVRQIDVGRFVRNLGGCTGTIQRAVVRGQWRRFLGTERMEAFHG